MGVDVVAESLHLLLGPVLVRSFPLHRSSPPSYIPSVLVHNHQFSASHEEKITAVVLFLTAAVLLFGCFFRDRAIVRVVPGI